MILPHLLTSTESSSPSPPQSPVEEPKSSSLFLVTEELQTCKAKLAKETENLTAAVAEKEVALSEVSELKAQMEARTAEAEASLLEVKALTEKVDLKRFWNVEYLPLIIIWRGTESSVES